jgi:hypothetical protein
VPDNALLVKWTDGGTEKCHREDHHCTSRRGSEL